MEKTRLTGIDPYIGDNDHPYLPVEITEHLAWIHMKTMDVLQRPKWAILKGGYWLNVRDLGLSGHRVVQWDTYIENLKFSGIKLNSEKRYSDMVW